MDIVVMQGAAGFGAEVEGVDLNAMQCGDVELLQEALLAHGLLVVRGQTMTPLQQIKISELFGKLETFPPTSSQIKGLPQIFRVASQPADGHVEVGRYWHSDGSFRAKPTPISLWYLVERPEEGGDTLFTDLQQAYRSLPIPLQKRVEGLQTMHRNGVVHPLVMPHPHTGVDGLYLNIGLTGQIVGLGIESASMIEVLDAHLSREAATYAHTWKVGDFLVADNFRVAHKATSLAPHFRRILNRTTVQADSVFWDVHDDPTLVMLS